MAADLGQTIRVVETASKAAYNDATSTSSQTAVVALGDFTNTAPVSITGTAKVGELLTRSAASWTPGPDARTYQWRRCDNAGANCADIGGETGNTYVLAAADLGQSIRVVETASKTAYNNANSTSTQTGVVATGDFTNSSPVSITGTVKVGETLARSAASWTPGPDSRAYQWRRCDNAGANCADLAGETGTSYTLVAADLGQTIRVVETASKTAYNDATSTSAQTVVVAPGDLTNTSPVSITGTPTVGASLTRSAAGWSPGPDSRAYQWRRCDAAGGNCADIAGATGTSYVLVGADFGQTIRVVETASKTAYNDAISTSVQTAVIAPGTITNTGVPTVSGTPTATLTLTATGGSWTPAGTSSAFQWVRCDADGTGCADLSGATGSTYVLVAGDVGKKLKVRETASKTGYTDASADSALTAEIADADLTPPTNTITLGSAAGAYLAGTMLYYRPAAAGSFTLSSAVADGGWGPAFASYPSVGQAGWTHGSESVTTPAGGPFVSSAFSWTGAAAGTFPYVVTAGDLWSPPNTSQTTLSVTEDSTPPASSIECDAAACSAGWYTSSPVSVTLSATDGGAGADLTRYTTNGTDPTLFNGTTYTGAFSISAEGTTTVKFRSFDRVGNTENVQTQVVRLDTVEPDTSIDTGPSGSTSATGAAFTFSSADAGATFECRLLPGGSWAACSSPHSYSSLADGTYTFEVRAIDQAGNTDASPATRTWTVDTVPADTTITSAPPADTNATGASFSFLASDAGPTFECKLDAGSFGACSSPKTYASLAEGSHTFSVRAVDAAGNADPTPASHTWTVDTTAPDTTIPLTPADPSSNTTPTFGFGSSQSPATYECRLDGGGWASCPTPHTVTPALADGSHTLEARATDAAGNIDGTPASSTWLVDATAPTGALTAPADGSAAAGTIAVTANSADAGGSGVMHALFETSPAGAGTWTAIGAPDTTSPYSVSLDTTTLADGDHDLRVTTRDNAGNSTVSATRTVEVDNTAPSLTVSAPNPVNLATADPATLTATASDTGTGVVSVSFEQCNETSVACDSDTWTSLGVDTTAPYSASWPLPGDGMRLLRVRATDGAGRVRTELVLTTVDRTVPSGTLTVPAAAANLRGSAPVAATAADGAPGGVGSVDFQITGQGAPYTDPAFASDSTGPSYDGTLDTTVHADGLYDLRAFVSDVNGNSAASARVTVRLDNTAPTGSVTAPAAGANLRGTVGLASDSADSGSGVATVQFQRSPAGAGSWTNQAATWNTTLLTDGLYDLRVVTTDNAGGSFTSPAITVRVDNTAPTGSVTAPAAGANLRGTVAPRERLRRQRLRCGHRAVPALPDGRRQLDEPGRHLEHHPPHRRPVRPPRRDHRQRRRQLHLPRNHRPRRQHRTDRLRHRAGERRRDRRPGRDAGERLRRPSSQWLSVGRRHRRLRAASRGRRRLDRDAPDVGHGFGAACGCGRLVRAARDDDRPRRQLLHVEHDHRPRRPHRAGHDRDAVAGEPEQRARHGDVHGRRRHRLRRRPDLVPGRRRQHPHRHLGRHLRSGRPLERRLAHGRVLLDGRRRQRRVDEVGDGRHRHHRTRRQHGRPRLVPPRYRPPQLLDARHGHLVGPVPVHARRHEPVGRGRRRRRDAAVRGLLGHDARRRRRL